LGRTGAISVSSPCERPISAIRWIMRLLRPWPRYSGAIRIWSAQRTFGVGAPRRTGLDDGVDSAVGQRCGSPSQVAGIAFPPPTTSSRSSSQA
jgi:hypothetical protein